MFAADAANAANTTASATSTTSTTTTSTTDASETVTWKSLKKSSNQFRVVDKMLFNYRNIGEIIYNR